MRLLMTTDAVGGVWHYAIELAAALRERGVEVVLAVLGPAPSADKRAAARAAGVRLIATGLPLDWLCDAAAPVRAAACAVADLARAEQVDLVQLHTPTLAAGAQYPAAVLAVAHGCVSTWWAAARDGALDPAFDWHHALMAEGLAAADMVVTPSAAYAAMVARHYGLRGAPIAVHNGRTRPEMMRQGPYRDAAITVGRLWDDAKNAALLDRVAARLAIPFCAVGAATSPHGEAIALDHLAVTGEIGAAALAERLAQRPVFVSAARFEPFGLAVLEAAGAGCALVLSDIATFRELWEGAALFVATDDEAGYAAAIERLIGDGALRQRLGAAARERAARYTTDRMADAMLLRYRALLRAEVAVA